MKKLLYTIPFAATLLLAGSPKGAVEMPVKQAPAKGEMAAPAPAAQGESVIWYEGGVAQNATIDPELIAEFGGSKTLGKQTKAVEQNDRSGGKVTLWRISEGSTPTVVKSAKTTNPKGVYSPVLRDASGQIRALPGGVIVRLNPNLSSQEAAAWLADQNLTVIRPLEIGKNTFVIRSEAGLASLELANTLQQTEGVVWAQPDWWQERVKR